MLACWRSENVDGGGDADRRGVPERFSRRGQHEARPRVASRGGGQGCFEAVSDTESAARKREIVDERCPHLYYYYFYYFDYDYDHTPSTLQNTLLWCPHIDQFF